MFNRYKYLQKFEDYDNGIKSGLIENLEKRGKAQEKLVQKYKQRVTGWLNDANLSTPRLNKSSSRIDEYQENKQRLLEPDRNREGGMLKYTLGKNARIKEAELLHSIIDQTPNQMDRIHEFRTRDRSKEINRSMRYKAQNDMEHIYDGINIIQKEREKFQVKDINFKLNQINNKMSSKSNMNDLLQAMDNSDKHDDDPPELRFSNRRLSNFDGVKERNNVNMKSYNENKLPHKFKRGDTNPFSKMSPELKRKFMDEAYPDNNLHKTNKKAIEEIANGVILGSLRSGSAPKERKIREEDSVYNETKSKNSSTYEVQPESIIAKEKAQQFLNIGKKRTHFTTNLTTVNLK